MDFEEFCAATLSVHQLEALDRWEQHARCAYDLFEKDGNRAIVIEELASVCLICLCDETSVHQFPYFANHTQVVYKWFQTRGSKILDVIPFY